MKLRILLPALFTAAAFSAGHAFAQESAPAAEQAPAAESAEQASPDAPADATNDTTEKRTPRTATERAELLPTITVVGSDDGAIELPGSADYLDTFDIRYQNYEDINRILRKAPGVYVREEDGYGLFPNVSVRGVDPSRSAKMTMMEDGILAAPAPYSAPSAYYSPTAGRMHAIEVLKGSSQVQYGPHITGGVLNYISTPIPYEEQGYLKTIYGTDNEVRLHGWYGNVFQTNDWGSISFLVEGYLRRTDGFKDFDSAPDFNGDDTGFLMSDTNFKIAWEPDSEMYQRWELKVGYSHRDADETYTGLSDEDFDDDPYRRYAATRFDNITSNQTRFYLRHYMEPTPDLSFSTTLYYNKFHRNWYKLNDLRNVGAGDTNMSISAALAGFDGGSGLALLRGEGEGELRYRANNRDYYMWGAEEVMQYHFITGEWDHTLTAGLRLHYDQADRFQHQDVYAQDASGAITGVTRGTPGSQSNRRDETTAIAVFVQDRMEIGKLAVTPGVRFEHIMYDFDDFNSGASGSDELNVVGGGVGATYDLTEEWTLLGGIYRGYSPPGPRAYIASDADVETSIATELGANYRHASGAFTAKGTLFYSTFDDLLVADSIASGGGDSENVGEVDSYGLELYLEYDAGIANNWGFSNPYFLAYTYTHAELASDTGSLDAESIFSGGEKGNKVPYIPENQLTIGTGLEFKRWGAYITGIYVDETYTSASNTSNQVDPDGDPDARYGKTDDYFIVDVSAYYMLQENVKLLGGVQNAFDEEYVASRHPHGSRPGAPLFAYVGLEINF